MSEWLRSLTRNQMGSARTGSNPVGRELFLTFLKILNYQKITTIDPLYALSLSQSQQHAQYPCIFTRNVKKIKFHGVIM